jgi:ribosome-associated protein
MTELELAREIVKVLDNKKGMDINLIEIAEHSIVADYFVIVSGTSNTHVKALADEVEYELTQKGIEPHHIEGRATGWILLDYNTVVVHLFTPDQRETYSLEHLWGDAKEYDISTLITED